MSEKSRDYIVHYVSGDYMTHNPHVTDLRLVRSVVRFMLNHYDCDEITLNDFCFDNDLSEFDEDGQSLTELEQEEYYSNVIAPQNLH